MRRINDIKKQKSVKPITRINREVVKQWDTRNRLARNGFGRKKALPATGGLALQLADDANKYSKMKVQLEA